MGVNKAVEGAFNQMSRGRHPCCKVCDLACRKVAVWAQAQAMSTQSPGGGDRWSRCRTLGSKVGGRVRSNTNPKREELLQQRRAGRQALDPMVCFRGPPLPFVTWREKAQAEFSAVSQLWLLRTPGTVPCCVDTSGASGCEGRGPGVPVRL